MRRLAPWLLPALLLLGAASLTPAVDAQPKKPAPAKKWGKKPAKPPEDAKEAKDAKDDAKTDAKDETSKESKGAGTEEVKKAAATSGGGPSVTETKTTGDAGVKTYKFGPVEVEGRLKSPQVVYFMRRVRAEFAAGALGHRSFMRELSDTRSSPAFK